ncbi:hypothetical protein ES288_A02G004700v1 [Gossypium darwinii]|uniref:non-specific serine/threonine protein kinase n=1 Tax=Gossypium darwinii TaxID=34276 RepID=A0A5D2H8V2_GOSDA|nr:hypothetical protein ES288_A02G004700v1 [Gossypium darwinii]
MALLGKYEVGKWLGYGAFAKVYQARNMQTGETVAIKAVSKKKVLHGKMMAQVKREIAIMRRLNHPNIVKLVEVLATKSKILSKKGYDGAKADIWSCGIVLYVLHAGYLPFNDANMTVMYRNIYRGEYKFPKWTSPELRRLISRLLDTNPETRITIDEIINDPWFKNGYKEVKVQPVDFDLKEETQSNVRFNAFDLISFSTGFDLSGLFNDTEFSVQRERFVSAEKQWRIIERIKEEVAKMENVEVISTRESGIRLEHQGNNLVIAIDINQLTEELVVVEAGRRELTAGSSDEIWNEKLKPRLSDLVYNSESEL